MTTWVADLKKVHACTGAIVWCESYPDLETAWAVCERGDWMLWLAAKTLDRKLVVAASCACARQALQFVPEGELRPLRAIETAEAWTRGEATLEQVRNAAQEAVAYACAASACAACAAAAAAYACACAASAAQATAASACAACATYASAADRSESCKASADICRRMLPCPPLGRIVEVQS